MMDFDFDLTNVRLFHGTSETAARRILKEGLSPRGLSRETAWPDCPSRTDAVYLTTSYAPYFAAQASEDENADILEIDVSMLDTDLMYPDEDYIEQATRGKDIIPGSTMEERTEFSRNNLKRFAAFTPQSIKHLGNCTYFGTIRPEAIKAYAVLNSEHPLVQWAMEPLITLANQRMCGHRYRALTHYLMGESGYEKEIAQTINILPADPSEVTRVLKLMEVSPHIACPWMSDFPNHSTPVLVPARKV